MRIHVRCPAKINLFLSVGPRDGRGYHPIRTVFQAVGLCDDLYLQTTDGEETFDCTCHWIENNSVLKALSLVREITRVPNLEISLFKHIPTEAGMGGGSSDAAGLLRGVQRIAQIGDSAEIQSIALAVGADVPFFLTGGRALGRGYGHHLTPLADRDRSWLLVAKPDVGCSTAEMYAKLDESPFEWREFPEDDILYNDFERVAPSECLELIERIKKLDAVDAGLTGSGSGVFGRFESEPLAEIACERLMLDFDGHAWVVPTLSRQESLEVHVVEP